MCLAALCLVTIHNLHEFFPSIQFHPRPPPSPASGKEYDAWLKEYEQWGALRCPCGNGYFCREHGSWISGAEVTSGTTCTAEEQKQGSCPSYHYGDYTDVKGYVGARDAAVQKS
ncbi:hypothetical protein QBC44DRAFT_369812 [Cladorrhinum sp. PSN332]|nr:hypothetical protein QBC44DRAFT_369812 [Cladorrhinum sp. PSN332]